MFRRAARRIASLFSSRIRKELREERVAARAPKQISPRDFVIEKLGLTEIDGNLFRKQAARTSYVGGKRTKVYDYVAITEAEMELLIPKVMEIKDDEYGLKQLRGFASEGIGTTEKGRDTRMGLFNRVGHYMSKADASLRGYKTHLYNTLDLVGGKLGSESEEILHNAIGRVSEVIDVSEIDHYRETGETKQDECYLVRLLEHDFSPEDLKIIQESNPQCYGGVKTVDNSTELDLDALAAAAGFKRRD